jgi:benzoyl-CoA reductase/2-hydroxyglutaryl-CoA dehydratase subunit BcrC/BadD/HgdB
MSLSLDMLPVAVDAVNTAYEEVQERIDKGFGVVKKESPRVLAILPDQHSDPRFAHLVGELGMAIVGTDTSYLVPIERVSKDPYMVLAQRQMHSSIVTVLSRRLSLIMEGCKRLKVDGLLDRFHVGCRTVATDAMMIQEAVEKELGIPVLLLEWENFDPRMYNHEEFKRRLEVFKTMMAR